MNKQENKRVSGKRFSEMNKNRKGRTIEEIYGKEKKEIKKKIDLYSSLGYKTLIIWNKELNNEQKVVQKIKEFIK